LKLGITIYIHSTKMHDEDCQFTYDIYLYTMKIHLHFLLIYEFDCERSITVNHA